MTPNDARLPPSMGKGQFWLLVLSTIGVFVGPGLVRLSRGGALGATMTDGYLLGVVGRELVLGTLWARHLARQGWTIASFTEPFVARDVLRGVLLFVVAWVAYYLTWVLTFLLTPHFAEAARAVTIDGRPSLPVVVLVSVINPVAEEFLYLGVIGASLKRQGVVLALSGSLVARVIVHLYQGPLGILTTIPVGLVFGIYYLRTRRLWPLVLTHGLMDLAGLAALGQSAA